MLKIDKISCLCLDRRKEMWTQLEKELAQYGLAMNKFIAGDGSDPTLDYDYIDVKKPHKNWQHEEGQHALNTYNCFCCHQRMIQSALSDGVDSVLMLEDDAYLTSRFFDVLPKVATELSTIQWDMLYLGYLQEGRTEEDERAYRECGYASIGKAAYLFGLYGVIIKRELFPLLLSFPPVMPIDTSLYLRVGLNNLKAYYVRPRVIHIRDTISEVSGKPQTREIL